jgi:NAD(P)H-binding
MIHCPESRRRAAHDPGSSGPKPFSCCVGGMQGATGRRVAELLLARGIAVRAFVRTRDERAEQLRELGADLAVGDLRLSAALADAGDLVSLGPLGPAFGGADADAGQVCQPPAGMGRPSC